MAWFNPFKRSFSTEELVQCRFLGKCRLFQDFRNEELSLFLPYLFLRTYNQEEAVFFREDPAQAIYIVRSGVVRLSVEINDRLEDIGLVKAYGALGENAVWPNSRRLYNAIVESETAEIYVIPHANLYDIYSRHSRIKAKLFLNLARMQQQQLNTLFKAYRKNFGFFELGQVFGSSSGGNQ